MRSNDALESNEQRSTSSLVHSIQKATKSTMFRIAYARHYQTVHQPFQDTEAEIEQNVSKVLAAPLLGSFSAFPNTLALRLQNIYNATAVLVRHDGMIMGTNRGNYTFDGLIGIVQRHEADLVIMPTLIQKIPGVEFTNLIFDSHLTLLQTPIAKNTSNSEYKDFLEQLTSVYDLHIWALINITLLVVGLSLLFNRARSTLMKFWTEFFHIMYKLYLMLIDETEFDSCSYKTHILLGTAIFGIFIIVELALNWVCSDTVYQDRKYYDNLQEVLDAKQNQIEMFWFGNGYALPFFQGPDNRLLHAIYKKHCKARSIADGYKELFERMGEDFDSIKDKYMLVEEDRMVRAVRGWICMVLQTKLVFTKVPVPGLRVDMAYAFNEKLDEKYKHLIYETSRDVMEHGFTSERVDELSILWHEYVRQEQFHICFREKEQEDVKAINIANMRLTLALCVGLLLCAGIIMLLELIVSKLFRLKNKTKRLKKDSKSQTRANRKLKKRKKRRGHKCQTD